MSKFPSKPVKGRPAISELNKSVNQIIDYLPSLHIVGDNKTTSVSHSSIGTTIHAKQDSNILPGGESNPYYAGSGLNLCGSVFNVDIDNNTIQFVGNKLSCVVEGGGGGGSGGIEYNDGRYIIISGDNNSINCTLSALTELYNDPIVSATHFTQVSDFKQGAGTTINFHYDSIGDHTIDGGGPDTLIKWINGLEVDLNVSGGQYITTQFYHGVGYGDNSSASIDCNLSGDKDVYSSGFISIVPLTDTNYNITGGIISTNLHGDETTIHIDPTDGTISCMLEGGSSWESLTPNLLSVDNINHKLSAAVQSGGGTTIIEDFGVPDYFNLAERTGMDTVGPGYTWLLPVSAGASVSYATEASGLVNASYSPLEGEQGTSFYLERDTLSTVPANGHVRLTVFDDGNHKGQCVRFYYNTNDWTSAYPVYKFGSFQSLTGDGSTVLVTGNTISANVWQYEGDGVNINVDNINHIISYTGSGGGGGGSEIGYNYIFSSGVYQATAGSRYLIRYPHIPILDEEYWPQGWQPPVISQGSEEYISHQWPLYQYYYNQPAYPPLPCGYLCSLYDWAAGDYGMYSGHGKWDILIKLPNATNQRMVVEIVNYTDTAVAVVSDNQKQIIPQSWTNDLGDSQHAYAIQYPNYLYSFVHGNYNGCCKMLFYYDPNPPYSPQRTPYATDKMQQLTSGGCWFAQMFCN